jgi:hypothetical protein
MPGIASADGGEPTAPLGSYLARGGHRKLPATPKSKLPQREPWGL